MNDIYIFAACRDVKSDSATNATWFQTFPPYGRYPVGGTIKGAPADAEFVIDEASAKAVMDSFNALAKDANWPGILVDEEHYSLDREKSSAALKDAASAATKAKEDALAECRKMKCDAFIEAGIVWGPHSTNDYKSTKPPQFPPKPQPPKGSLPIHSSIQLGEPQTGLLDLLRGNPKLAPFADAIEGRQLEVTQDWRDTKRREGGTHLRHFLPTEAHKRKHPHEVAVTAEDMEMLPTMWRSPDRVIRLDTDKFLCELDAFDGSTYMMQIKLEAEGPKLWTFFKTYNPTSKKMNRPNGGTI